MTESEEGQTVHAARSFDKEENITPSRLGNTHKIPKINLHAL